MSLPSKEEALAKLNARVEARKQKDREMLKDAAPKAKKVKAEKVAVAPVEGGMPWEAQVGGETPKTPKAEKPKRVAAPRPIKVVHTGGDDVSTLITQIRERVMANAEKVHAAAIAVLEKAHKAEIAALAKTHAANMKATLQEEMPRVKAEAFAAGVAQGNKDALRSITAALKGVK